MTFFSKVYLTENILNLTYSLNSSQGISKWFAKDERKDREVQERFDSTNDEDLRVYNRQGLAAPNNKLNVIVLKFYCDFGS